MQADLENWFFTRRQCVEVLSLTGKSNYQQLGPRIIRGHMTRFLVAVHRQIIVLSKFERSVQANFLQEAMQLALTRLDCFEREIFDLIDKLELEGVSN